jgi:hypothetical protein
MLALSAFPGFFDAGNDLGSSGDKMANDISRNQDCRKKFVLSHL